MKDGEREASSIMMLHMRRVEDIWSLPSWTPFYEQMDICDPSSLTVKTFFAITNKHIWMNYVTTDGSLAILLSRVNPIN